MEELAPFDLDGCLPKAGLISIFYFDPAQLSDPRPAIMSDDDVAAELERTQAYFDALDAALRSSTPAEDVPAPSSSTHILQPELRVLYTNVDKNDLWRREIPADVPVDMGGPEGFRACTLACTTELLLPRGEDLLVGPPGDVGSVQMDRQEYALWRKVLHQRRLPVGISQLLGYPDIYSHGPRVIGEPPPSRSLSVVERRAKGLDYRLLLQLDTETQDVMGLSLGRTFFVSMRDQDLARLDFTRAWEDMD